MTVRKVLRALSTPVTLLILLGLLAAGVWWGYQKVTAEVPKTPPPACVTLPMTELLTSSVTVSVYNGGDTRGLAGRIAEKLRVGGYLVATVGNTEERVVATIIVGAAAENPEVQLVASWFTEPEIRADGRPDHSVDILVGNDYNEETGMNPTPPPSLAIPSGEVCLPPSPAPTETPTPSGEPT